jgi:putative heme-binding domain-containing protein
LALKNVPEKEFAYYNTISGDSLLNDKGRLLSSSARAKGPGRAWKLEEALQVVQNDSATRDFSNGQSLFAITMCKSCHSLGGEGGTIGPDLSQLGNRFTDKDILESIIDPNKEISDQYAATNFYLKDGTTVIGRLIKQDNDKYYVSQNPFAPLQLREVVKKEVATSKISDQSIMLPGMINGLNPKELQDLLAYLKSGGDENSKVYKKGK